MSEHITGVPGIVDYAQFVTETKINSSVAYFSHLVNYCLLAMFWAPTLTAWNSGDTQPYFEYHKPHELKKVGDDFFMDFSFLAYRFLKENHLDGDAAT